MINSNNKRRILVPGEKIRMVNGIDHKECKKLKAKAVNELVYDGSSVTGNIRSIFPNWNDNDILQPITQAHYPGRNSENPCKKRLSVTALTLLNVLDQGKLHVPDFGSGPGVYFEPIFNYHYQYTLEFDSTYELTIYISFRRTRRSGAPVENVIGFRHEMEFFENSFKTSQGKKIHLKNVSSVRVFLVNTNPQTSRGTTTVVQSGTGGN